MNIISISGVNYETLIHDKSIYYFSQELLFPEELTNISNSRICIMQHSLGLYVLAYPNLNEDS